MSTAESIIFIIDTVLFFALSTWVVLAFFHVGNTKTWFKEYISDDEMLFICVCGHSLFYVISVAFFLLTSAKSFAVIMAIFSFLFFLLFLLFLCIIGIFGLFDYLKKVHEKIGSRK